MKTKRGRPLEEAFKLRPHDRGKLQRIRTEKSQHDGRVHERAEILLKLAEGLGVSETANFLGISRTTVWRRREIYRESGLAAALQDAPRPGKPRTLTAEQEQRIIAIACTDPPPGHSHWTIRLLAQEAMDRKIVGSIGRHAIAITLERHELKPWREKNVVRRQAR